MTKEEYLKQIAFRQKYIEKEDKFRKAPEAIKLSNLFAKLAIEGDRQGLKEATEGMGKKEIELLHRMALNKYLENNIDVNYLNDYKDILPPSKEPLTDKVFSYPELRVNEGLYGRYTRPDAKESGYIPNSITFQSEEPGTLVHEYLHNWNLVNYPEYKQKKVDVEAGVEAKGLEEAEASGEGHLPGYSLPSKQILFELLTRGNLRSPGEIPEKNVYLSSSPDDKKPRFTMDPSVPRY
jgi:hypothetical protein